MLLGFHHVTALAGNAQASLDYCTQVLKMRLVKRTVNFDDPGTYHLYVGDSRGTPGTLLTFFPGFQRPAQRGAGQIVSISVYVPGGGPADVPQAPDGLDLEVAGFGAANKLQSVTLCENEVEPTAAFLGILGFERAGVAENRHRFELPGGGARIDVLQEPDAARGRMGAGGIHHVALRVGGEAEQLDWRKRLVDAGIRVSAVRDRYYFHSIYFREPGGALFEIATDGPGFLIDETEDAAGSALCLPPWLEPSRESIEGRLPALEVPQSAGARL